MIARLGSKVRRLREASGLSQAELAVALGLQASSKGYISEIERGKKLPTLALVLRIAQRFSVTTDYLLRDELGADAEEPTSS